MAEPPSAGERIRVGIVSGYFCDHTLFKLCLEGWLTNLDRTRFETCLLLAQRIKPAGGQSAAVQTRNVDRRLHTEQSAQVVDTVELPRGKTDRDVLLGGQQPHHVGNWEQEEQSNESKLWSDA